MRFAPDLGPIVEAEGPAPEDVLARALSVAVTMKRWDLVAQLTRELEAMRCRAAKDDRR